MRLRTWFWVFGHRVRVFYSNMRRSIGHPRRRVGNKPKRLGIPSRRAGSKPKRLDMNGRER